MTKFKSRCIKLVLYPEDETHLNAVHTICNGGYNYALILHDADIWEEADSAFDPERHTVGDKKKEHFHVVLKFQNPIWSSSLAAELGIAENYMMPGHNLNEALTYLIHFGFENKHQYDIECVQGTLLPKLQKLIVDEDEGERVLRIIDMIDSSPSPTYREILIKCCKAGLYGEFRRLGAGVKFLLEERQYEK